MRTITVLADRSPFAEATQRDRAWAILKTCKTEEEFASRFAEGETDPGSLTPRAFLALAERKGLIRTEGVVHKRLDPKRLQEDVNELQSIEAVEPSLLAAALVTFYVRTLVPDHPLSQMKLWDCTEQVIEKHPWLGELRAGQVTEMDEMGDCRWLFG